MDPVGLPPSCTPRTASSGSSLGGMSLWGSDMGPPALRADGVWTPCFESFPLPTWWAPFLKGDRVSLQGPGWCAWIGWGILKAVGGRTGL